MKIAKILLLLIVLVSLTAFAFDEDAILSAAKKYYAKEGINPEKGNAENLQFHSAIDISGEYILAICYEDTIDGYLFLYSCEDNSVIDHVDFGSFFYSILEADPYIELVPGLGAVFAYGYNEYMPGGFIHDTSYRVLARISGGKIERLHKGVSKHSSGTMPPDILASRNPRDLHSFNDGQSTYEFDEMYLYTDNELPYLLLTEYSFEAYWHSTYIDSHLFKYDHENAVDRFGNKSEPTENKYTEIKETIDLEQYGIPEDNNVKLLKAKWAIEYDNDVTEAIRLYEEVLEDMTPFTSINDISKSDPYQKLRKARADRPKERLVIGIRDKLDELYHYINTPPEALGLYYINHRESFYPQEPPARIGEYWDSIVTVNARLYYGGFDNYNYIVENFPEHPYWTDAVVGACSVGYKQKLYEPESFRDYVDNIYNDDEFDNVNRFFACACLAYWYECVSDLESAELYYRKALKVDTDSYFYDNCLRNIEVLGEPIDDWGRGN